MLFESELETFVANKIRNEFPEFFQKRVEVAGAECFLFSEKLKVSIDVNDETHDHSDAYHKYVERKSQLEKLGILYFLIEGFDAKLAVPQVIAQIKSKL